MISINSVGSQARVDFGSANHQRLGGKEAGRKKLQSIALAPWATDRRGPGEIFSARPRGLTENPKAYAVCSITRPSLLTEDVLLNFPGRVTMSELAMTPTHWCPVKYALKAIPRSEDNSIILC